MAFNSKSDESSGHYKLLLKSSIGLGSEKAAGKKEAERVNLGPPLG